jgi:hypothetical protein
LIAKNRPGKTIMKTNSPSSKSFLEDLDEAPTQDRFPNFAYKKTKRLEPYAQPLYVAYFFHNEGSLFSLVVKSTRENGEPFD